MSDGEVEQLNRRWAIDGQARFEPGGGGLTRLAIHAAQATAHVYLHGAHVTAWQPTDHAPVLWLSSASRFEASKPIRGGVPICFPWFGPKPDDPDAPAHGLARTRTWNVSGVHVTADDEVVATFETRLQAFILTYTVTVGRTLTMSLHVLNESPHPQRFEAALHTYLTVGDIRQARVTGLEGTTFIDKVDGGRRKTQPNEPVLFTQETDRVYLDTDSACVLHDPVLLRRIVVDKSGSRSTVVWNPWIAKAARMDDFGDHEWPGMCCIETACVADNAVHLSPGADHAVNAVLSVQRS